MALPVGSLLLLLGLFSHSYAAETIDPLFRVKRSQETYASEPGACSSTTKQQDVTDSSNFSVDIRMPGVVPPASDTYLCMSYPVPTTRDSYIVDFKPQASMKTVHHMLLFGCKSPYSKSGYWDCGTAHGTCRDEASIMYAWARNAPPTKLPKDVGFKVGRNSGITYFVLQMHYGDVSSFRDHHRDCSGLTLTMTTKPQPFIAGIYLLMTMDTVILPGKRVTNADVACDYSSDPIYPFAFRTHTHRLGKVVSGYRIRDGKWTLIGRQSPQLPQAFYPANKDATIKNGDTVAARCVFTGEGRTTITKIGGTSEDEMCNFYIMYYMDNKHAIPYMDCMEDGSPKLFQRIPAEANVPIAVNPGEMNSMMHMGHNADKPAVDTSGTEQDLSQDYHLEQDTSWPQSSLQLGQVSGLALDSDSNLVIFHRGEHEWGPNSFNNDARYMQKSLGPIQQSTILVVNPDDGSLLKASGRNLFFLPHGITTDMDNNYWVTDVALHQVLKVSSDGRDRILLTLGEAFTPGTDHNHFCKPTDVAVDPHTGNIFVSDGYCNARILKYSPKGKYLSEWGAGSTDRRRRVPFSIPHSLAFLPDRNEVCVADRENGRIQCFNAETGEFVKEIKKEEFGGEVYAISYSPSEDGVIYAVNGESLDGPSAPIQGFAINYSTKDILDTFRPESKEFKMPHDIVQTKDASVFVGDVDSKFVFKFTTEKSHRSVKKAGIEVLEVATIIKTKLIPGPNESKPVAIKEKQILVQQPEAHTEPPELKKEKKLDESQGALPVVITTLLLVPLVLVIAVGVFICWRKNNRYEVKSDPTSVGGILGKIRGKSIFPCRTSSLFVSSDDINHYESLFT
ncbi:peptidyl-glycine alpha-amidating monooxygenase B isoform 2-T2 [Synchiropus picturatus]